MSISCPGTVILGPAPGHLGEGVSVLRLADIHCHILPYVDDGAEHMEQAEILLASAVDQGIRVICATPHLRQGMFESADEEIVRQYRRVRGYIQEQGLPIQLFLSREYFCDDSFLKRLSENKLIPMGLGKTILSEFSGRYSAEKIEGYLKRILEAGWTPLIAHVERYRSLDEDRIRGFVEMGAKVQINAGSVLGREGRWQKKLCWFLLRHDLVHAVASDAHDPIYRPNELGLCARKIEHKLGQARAQRVLWDSPREILSVEEYSLGICGSEAQGASL